MLSSMTCLDVDGTSVEANPGLWKQMLQENASKSYREHKTNEYVRQQVNILAGHNELLLSTVKCHKLSRFGHVCRHYTLINSILQRTVNGSHRRGKPRKLWKANIKVWTGQSMSLLLRITNDRGRWAVITADASVGVPERRLGVMCIS